MRMKTHTSALAILAAVVLAGCGKKPDDLIRESAVLGGQALKAVAEAKKAPDPWVARQQLVAKWNELSSQLSCIDGGMERVCGDMPDDAVASVRSTLQSLERDAFARGNQDAIAWAYSRAVVYDATEEDRQRLKFAAPDILKAAKVARGTAADAVTLRVAGLLLAAGQLVQRDTATAESYLARAWAAGIAPAANDAAVVYLQRNDTRNAYLWSVRCVAGCVRDGPVALDQLQQLLAPEAAQQAEKAAADPTIIELDTWSL